MEAIKSITDICSTCLQLVLSDNSVKRIILLASYLRRLNPMLPNTNCKVDYWKLLSAAGGVVNSGKHTADSANHAYFFGRGRSTVHLPPICYDGGVDDGQLFGDEHHFGVDACHVLAEG